MTRSRTWVLYAGVAALVALILVSAGLAEVTMKPGHELPIVAQQDEDRATKGGGAFLRWDAGMEVFMRIVFAVVIVLLPASIVAFLVSPEMRKQVLARLIPPALIIVYVLLVRERAERPENAGPAVPVESGATAASDAGPKVTFDASPPKTVVWGTRIAAGIGLALAAWGGACLLRRVRSGRGQGPLDKVAEQAKQAIEALEAGGEVRNVVLRCYFEMSRILDEERGLVRQSTMTPREFERSLLATGLPEAAVERLTRLFEAVRYGARSTGGAEEAQAIASLTAIADACRSAA